MWNVSARMPPRPWLNPLYRVGHDSVSLQRDLDPAESERLLQECFNFLRKNPSPGAIAVCREAAHRRDWVGGGKRGHLALALRSPKGVVGSTATGWQAAQGHPQILPFGYDPKKLSSRDLSKVLGDITQFRRNQLVALVGVAPFDADSGTHRGRRRIEGGRAKVRRTLYMAAQSAAAHNPVIKPYVARLKERNKSHKVALTAAMRKIIIHLHSIAKNQNLSLA